MSPEDKPKWIGLAAVLVAIAVVLSPFSACAATAAWLRADSAAEALAIENTARTEQVRQLAAIVEKQTEILEKQTQALESMADGMCPLLSNPVRMISWRQTVSATTSTLISPDAGVTKLLTWACKDTATGGATAYVGSAGVTNSDGASEDADSYFGGDASQAYIYFTSGPVTLECKGGVRDGA